MTGMPKRMFMRVDLPAPFSPTRAWISPAETVRETPFKTRLPSNSFTTSRSSRAAALPLVVDVADKEQVRVALGFVVLGQRDRDLGQLLHVGLHLRRILVVGFSFDGVDHQIGHRPDR